MLHLAFFYCYFPTQLFLKQNLHSEEISNHVAILAKNKNIRKIINQFQKKIIKKNKKICVEGRDIASKILSKNPKYDIAFYFKCSLKVASYRRWIDINRTAPLRVVKRSLQKRTIIDKKRKHSPLKKHQNAVVVNSGKFGKQAMLAKMSKYVERVLKTKYGN